MNEKRQAVSEQEVIEQPTSSDTEDDKVNLTIFDHIIIHCQNSSLLIFPQGSVIRNCCQLCIQQDPASVETKKDAPGSASDNLLQKSNSA